MKRRCFATLLCVGFLASCGTRDLSGTEVSWADCRDGIDNDKDGLTDCLDPDCRAIPCVEPNLPDAARDAQMMDAALDAQSVDAASDATDAAKDAPPTCEPACVAGEVCDDLTCRLALPTEVRIEILSMDGPSTVVGAFLQIYCADEFGPEPCAPSCSGCPPDPYVRVDRERVDRIGRSVITNVGRTTEHVDTTTAAWTDENRWKLDRNPVQLDVGDRLRLVAMDQDDNRPGDTLFGCNIDVNDLRMGEQECVSRPPSGSPMPNARFIIRFDVRAP